MTDTALARAIDQALDDNRIHLGPRTRAAFIARLIDLLADAHIEVVASRQSVTGGCETEL